MTNSEVIPSRKRVVLSEYGKPIKTLKNNEVTVSDNGVVSPDGENFLALNDEDRRLVKTLWDAGTKIEILELQAGLRIKADSRVGHVAFSNFDLVIRPKFDNLTKHDDPLATLLAYAFNLNNLKIVGEQHSPETDFAEILIHWLLGAVRNIQRRGLFQQYRKERRDLSVIRGKIDLKTWMRRRGIPSETMPCVFYRRSLDNILNQTLCAGLRRSAVIASSLKLKSQCRFLADSFALDGVTDKTLDYRMLTEAGRGLNRLNAHYENAVKIIEMLYEGSGGFVLGDQRREQVRIPGFFFDMNLLFERVFERFFEDHLPKKQYKLLYNSGHRIFSGYYGEGESLMEIDAGRKWRARPDFVVRKKDTKKRIVLDTKYHSIVPGQEKKLDQLCLYALAFSEHPGETPNRRATILFPFDPEINESTKPWNVALHRYNEKIGNTNDLGNAKCIITLRPIKMNCLARMIGINGDKMKKKREEFALKLIGELK